jgi:hypothetical protein
VQVRAVEAYADIGLLLAQAGTTLSDAAAGILEPADERLPLSAGVDALKRVETALHAGVISLEAAETRVANLSGYRLLGPLQTAHDELVRRLPRLRAHAATSDDGLAALIAFSGGAGSRRYLLFSQNPDEVRPTGGYIGTYGVLHVGSGRLTLERYASTESWYNNRPEAVVAPQKAPTPFRLSTPPAAQTIANVNAVADWPQTARLALELWNKGGERPVDGAVSFTPEFLARVLAVVGPVDVPSYGETVNASNLLERADFYTHGEGQLASSDPKQFLVVGFEAREAMAWLNDPVVAGAVARRHWDGVLVPQSAGDFFYGAEFEHSAKNGRGLHRTYDHQVRLQPDGSARVSTNVNILNSELPGPNNVDSLSYITVYGPQGAVLEATSDPGVALEASLAGHPAGAWFRAAAARGQTTLHVAWDAPGLIRRRGDGTWTYQLRWVALPGHASDVLHLRVEPPPGWAWKAGPPPTTVRLDRDLVGSWDLIPARSSFSGDPLNVRPGGGT